jgi:hypothetical protein
MLLQKKKKTGSVNKSPQLPGFHIFLDSDLGDIDN